MEILTSCSFHLVLQNKDSEDRVMMDFSGKQGRVISNPTEAIAIAKEEEYNWRVSNLPSMCCYVRDLTYACKNLYTCEHVEICHINV